MGPLARIHAESGRSQEMEIALPAPPPGLGLLKIVEELRFLLRKLVRSYY